MDINRQGELSSFSNPLDCEHEGTYWVYFLEVRGGALYCGVTSDLVRRTREHAHLKRGARFTKAHRPVRLLAAWCVCGGRSAAQRIESRLKKGTRAQKLSLIERPAEITLMFGGMTSVIGYLSASSEMIQAFGISEEKSR